MKNSSGLVYCYVQLCAAIVNSGIRQNDQAFLKSEWCKELTDYVVGYNNKCSGKQVNLAMLRRTGGRDE